MKKYNMRITAFIALFGFLNFGVLGGTITSLTVAPQSADAAAAVAKKTAVAYVSEVKGWATVNGTQTKSQAKVYVGDKLATKKDGFISIVFTSDKSVLRLNKLSAITIAASNPQKTTIQADEGSFWTRILRGIGVKGDYEVKTKSTSASIRGTSAFFSVNSTAKTFGVQVLDSYNTTKSQLGVTVKNAGSTKTTQIKPEQAYTYNTSTKKTKTGRIQVSSTVKKDSFVKENMRKDLSYMSDIVNSYGKGSKAFMAKVKGELGVTMPVGLEKTALLYSSQIGSQAQSATSLTASGYQALLLKDEFIKQASPYLDTETLTLLQSVDMSQMGDMQSSLDALKLATAADAKLQGILQDANTSLQQDYNTLLNIDIDLVEGGDSVTTTKTTVTCTDANMYLDTALNKCVPKDAAYSCTVKGGAIENGSYLPVTADDGSVLCQRKCDTGYQIAGTKCVKSGTSSSSSPSCSQLAPIINGYWMLSGDSCTNMCNTGYIPQAGTDGAPVCSPVLGK